MSEDPYKIKPVLEQFLICNEAIEVIADGLTVHLDKTLTAYLQDRDTMRKSAFNEIKCYLLQALIDTPDGDDVLKEQILQIVKGM